MALVKSVREYINRMLQDISGMKVLILDADTVISIALSNLNFTFCLFFFSIMLSSTLSSSYQLAKIRDSNSQFT